MNHEPCEARVRPIPVRRERYPQLGSSNDDHRLGSLDLVDGCMRSEHVVQESESEHIFQSSDNAIDSGVYDECAGSTHEQRLSEASDAAIEDEETLLRKDENTRQISLEKRRYALRELVDTEKSYIRELEKIVFGYMEVIRSGSIEVPKDLMRGKIGFVFGNIQEIHEFHKEHLLPRLEACLEKPEHLGTVFKQCERQMRVYVGYHKNKPYSEYIVSEYEETFFAQIRQQLGHSLALSDLLIRPVQRPVQYKLILPRILGASKKAGITEGIEDLEHAVELMHLLPQLCNDMLEIGRIKGFEGKLGRQEKLLRQGQLLVLDMSPISSGKASIRVRFKQRRVFLFEQIIIFCEMSGGNRKFTKPTFYFKHSMPLNKTKLHHEGMEPLQFLLTTKSELEEGETFVLQAPSEQDRQEWIDSIGGVLKAQEILIQALGSPIAYHEGLVSQTPSPRNSENPLSPNMMLRVSSLKKKSRKKLPSVSSADKGQGNDPQGAEAERGNDTVPDTPTTSRKPFLQDSLNFFRSLKRMLNENERSHI